MAKPRYRDKRKTKPAVLKSVAVRLPFGIGEAVWECSDGQCRAAWALYVELVTRIAVEPLPAQQGLVREALNFLSKWHPKLTAWEARRKLDEDPVEHERRWPEEQKAREELSTLRGNLKLYADALATIMALEL